MKTDKKSLVIAAVVGVVVSVIASVVFGVTQLSVVAGLLVGSGVAGVILESSRVKEWGKAFLLVAAAQWLLGAMLIVIDYSQR